MKLRHSLSLVAMLAAAGLPVLSIAQTVATQPLTNASPTLIVVPAHGEVVQPNDQAQATLTVEEQDKDKSAAASRVNQKMNQGLALLRQRDPQAKLQTRGYYTYAIYPENPPRTGANAGADAIKPRVPIGWRVGQSVELTTTNLAALPQTISAAQGVLGLGGLHFGLSPAAARRSDAALIDATYKNLSERTASIARAMGRNPADAVLDTLDFEGSGNYAPSEAMPKAAMMMRASSPVQDNVAEPNFEPGETTLTMRAVGKLKFR